MGGRSGELQAAKQGPLGVEDTLLKTGRPLQESGHGALLMIRSIKSLTHTQCASRVLRRGDKVVTVSDGKEAICCHKALYIRYPYIYAVSTAIAIHATWHTYPL